MLLSLYKFVFQTAFNANVISKLLTKVLAGIEEVRQTQKVHSAMLQSLQKQRIMHLAIHHV